MKENAVDILLATYNGMDFIIPQIESILGQTHANVRLMIRDDGSTDDTVEILKEYASKHPSKITLLPPGERLGIKGNFSHLMTHSQADYILFADQDDIWDRDKVSITLKKMKELEALHTSKCPLLVHSDLKVMDDASEIVSSSFWKYASLNPYCGHTLNRLLMQNVVTGCAMMFNRPLLHLALPIPETAVMHDWWLALVASAFGNIGEVPEATIMYRQHGKNALGAKKLLSLKNISFHLQRLLKLKPARLTISKREAQAKELFMRYSNRLSNQQIALLLGCLGLSTAPFLSRVNTIFKYKLYRMGFIRNIVEMLGIFRL